MSKELEALERLYCAGRLDLDYVTNGRQKEDFETIEKEIKALEIIRKYAKEQVANIDNKSEQKCLLVLIMDKEKEYDLLKEVLLYDK